MKIILSIILAVVLIPKICLSQFSILSQHVFQPSDIVSVSYLDTTGFNPGIPGANVVWDYSNISVLGTSIFNYYYSNAFTAPCQVDSFNMNSTYGQSGDSYSYYFLDSTALIYRGSCYEHLSPLAYNSRYYSNAPIMLIFPFSYNDQYSDTAIGNVISGPPNTYWNVSESHFRHYDAFGTLILPWSTFNNVARVHTSRYRRDSVISFSGSGIAPTLYVQSVIGYDWYDYNSHGPILKYYDYIDTTFYSNGTIQTYNWKEIIYFSTVTLGILNDQPQLNTIAINSNPSNGAFRVVLSQPFVTSKPILVKIFDAMGRVILNNQFSITCSDIEMNLLNKAPGIYFVTVEQGKVSGRAKLILQ